MPKRTKQSIVVETLRKVSEDGVGGNRVLKKDFFDLLQAKGVAKAYPQTLFVGYKKLKLFYCFPTDNNVPGRQQLQEQRRYLDNVKYKRPADTNKQIPGFDDNHDVYLTTQLGEGNLGDFVALVKAYEQTTGGAILAQGDITFLLAPRNRGGDQGLSCEDFPLNRIVFGAPGTGKSYLLEKDRKRTVGEDEGGERFFEDSCCERVTFYPTYSYAQFVGSYKPVMKYVDKDGVEIDEPPKGVRTRKAIAYEFVPGPFLRILKDALRDDNKNYLLIIEEINRANAAAVFGDVFQLLDRKNEDDGDAPEGWSEFCITPCREMIEYLTNKDAEGKDGVSEDIANKLRIPSNLYIWATMNSADQGVFPLDTAFKRRWDFEYMPLDPRDKEQKEMDSADVYIGDNCKCTWGKIRRAINNLLKRNQVNEDKLLSFSFVRSDEDRVISSNRFKMKVLMYLWEDAARMCRKSVFADGLGAFSDLMEKWDSVKYNKDDDGLLKSVFRFDDSKDERVELKQRVEPESNAAADTGAGEAQPTGDIGTGEAQPGEGGNAETGDAATADAGTGAEPAAGEADATGGDAVKPEAGEKAPAGPQPAEDDIPGKEPKPNA